MDFTNPITRWTLTYQKNTAPYILFEAGVLLGTLELLEKLQLQDPSYRSQFETAQTTFYEYCYVHQIHVKLHHSLSTW